MARFEVPEGWCVQAFRFTLDPTEDQARALARHFGARRTAYNWTVATLKTDIEAWQAGVTARFAAAAPDVVDTQQQAREYRCSCCRRCSPPHAEPGTWVFIIFYGLDGVATVPPTIVSCRDFFGSRSPIVFGGIFGSHQLGAAVAAAGAGWIRDLQGDCDLAFYLAAGLCFVAVALCAGVRRPATPEAARSRSIWRDPPWRIRFIRRRGDAEA